MTGEFYNRPEGVAELPYSLGRLIFFFMAQIFIIKNRSLCGMGLKIG